MSQALSRRALVFGPAFRAQLQQRLPQLQQRAASGKAHKRTASPAAREESQGKVLEKPDRFRPPSHPQKLRSPAPIRHYGPSLSAEERAAQRKRKYPNMMPPEGSFMFWFLTNRTIHMWIPLCVLLFCAFWAIGLNFKHNSPYYDLMPAKGDYIFHPFASIRQFLHVYKMHVLHNSEKVAEIRKKEIEDVQKQRAYKVAHGLEAKDGPGLTPTVLNEGNPEAEMGADGQVAVEAQQVDEIRGPKRYKKWFGLW